MLDLDEMPADMPHQDGLFALKPCRSTVGYMAGAAGFSGAPLVIFK